MRLLNITLAKVRRVSHKPLTFGAKTDVRSKAQLSRAKNARSTPIKVATNVALRATRPMTATPLAAHLAAPAAPLAAPAPHLASEVAHGR